MSDPTLPDLNELWDYAEPAQTRERFLTVLAEHEGDAPPDYLLEIRTQIARTHGLQQQFDSAHAILDQVEEELAGSTVRVKVRYLLERGRTFNSSDQKERAVPLFKQAWEEARNADLDALAVDAAHMVAIAAPPEEQLPWNERALELARSSDDPRAQRWQGSLFNNVGWTYFDREDYEQALEMFEQALAFRVRQGEKDEIRIARWCKAKCLRYLGRVEESLAIQQELEAACREAGKPDGYVHEELGECLVLLGRTDEATPHFHRAWDVLHTDIWLSRNEPERLARLKRLGGVEED